MEEPTIRRTGVTGDREIQAAATGTPFSRFYPPVLNARWDSAEAELDENVEWDMMPNGQILKGKDQVMAFIKAAVYASHREPQVIGDVFANEWGIFEYWNIGTVTEDLVEFAKASEWPIPHEGKGLAGRQYKVPVCFVYHVNGSGKIDLVREYLDVGSLVTQFAH